MGSLGEASRNLKKAQDRLHKLIAQRFKPGMTVHVTYGMKGNVNYSETPVKVSHASIDQVAVVNEATGKAYFVHAPRLREFYTL